MGTLMAIETVEISTPVEESPAVSWVAIAAGAIRCCRSDSRSSCVRRWHGLLGCIPVGQFRRVGQHIPNWHRRLSDLRCYARLCHWRLHRGASAYEMGRRTYARSLLSRYRSWLFGMGIRHGAQRCVFGCGGQQHRGGAIISQSIGNPVGGIWRSGGLLRGRTVAIQSYRKPEYGRFGGRSPGDRWHPHDRPS